MRPSDILRSMPLLAILLCLPAVAEEPFLLAEKADGILGLEGENLLEVVGLHGTISLRQGKAGEIRYAARTLDNRRAAKPVALWVEDRKLTLTAVEGDDTPVLIEVTLSPRMRVRVTVSDSTVKITGLHGDVRVRGKNLQLLTRGIVGALDLEIEGGTVDVEGVTQELILEGHDLEAKVGTIGGPLTLELTESSIQMRNIRDELSGGLETCKVVANNILGRIRLDLDGGSVDIGSAESGGELRLSDAPLKMANTKGAFDVRTDADVQFSMHEGPLRIEGFGSTIRGTGISKGLLDIVTSQGEVILQDLKGSTKIEGDGLLIQVKNTEGDLIIDTSSSSISIEKAEKPVMLNNEFGDIEVRDAVALVQVTSRDGTVRILDTTGPVNVDADGPEVEVTWIKLPGTEISVVENIRGDVRIKLPAMMRVLVDAEAPFGRIETDLEDLKVSDDGHSVRGELRAGRRAAPHVKKPTVRASAGGDLYLHRSTARQDGR